MQLTGKQIAEREIVVGYDKNNAVQQQGIDVRVNKIFKPIGIGEVTQTKTYIPQRKEVYFGGFSNEQDNFRWSLNPGYYEIELMEGVNIPNNVSLHFKTRSSLVRCGAIIHSGQFDGGFFTDKAGCYLQVIRPIVIEHGSRIAQAICFESAEVENLYDGQFQGDKQRN